MILFIDIYLMCLLVIILYVYIKIVWFLKSVLIFSKGMFVLFLLMYDFFYYLNSVENNL